MLKFYDDLKPCFVVYFNLLYKHISIFLQLFYPFAGQKNVKPINSKNLKKFSKKFSSIISEKDPLMKDKNRCYS